MNRARILLVDDHPLMCEGIRLILEKEPDLMVVGQANDANAALEQFRALKPDLTLMDIDLGDANGLDLAEQLLQEAPGCRIALLSGMPSLELVQRAVRARLHGYLLKAKASEELLQGIRAVLADQPYLCHEALRLLLSDYRRLLAAGGAPSPGPALSEREREVLKLTAEGLRVKDIARRLNIGIKTVDTHRSKLLAKLDCSSTAELTRYAIREGIIKP
jgi:DNA-binding NarL/FixJ family response regulator